MRLSFGRDRVDGRGGEATSEKMINMQIYAYIHTIEKAQSSRLHLNRENNCEYYKLRRLLLLIRPLDGGVTVSSITSDVQLEL